MLATHRSHVGRKCPRIRVSDIAPWLQCKPSSLDIARAKVCDVMLGLVLNWISVGLTAQGQPRMTCDESLSLEPLPGLKHPRRGVMQVPIGIYIRRDHHCLEASQLQGGKRCCREGQSLTRLLTPFAGIVAWAPISGSFRRVSHAQRPWVQFKLLSQ